MATDRIQEPSVPTSDKDRREPAYAALADEIHARPADLNVLVPLWTQRTVEQIFATHLEDWPALLRSLRVVGEDVRKKAREQSGPQSAAE